MGGNGHWESRRWKTKAGIPTVPHIAPQIPKTRKRPGLAHTLIFYMCWFNM
jgi:hypothetical protein